MDVGQTGLAGRTAVPALLVSDILLLYMRARLMVNSAYGGGLTACLSVLSCSSRSIVWSLAFCFADMNGGRRHLRKTEKLSI